MSNILTILDKEWAEVFKNRVVLFTVVFMPLILVAIPLASLSGMSSLGPGGAVSEMPVEFTRVCGEVTGTACSQIFIMYQFMLLFLMLPLAIPIAISAYSIVGEKTTRCLEPLLATPITTLELIIGKALSAAIPAIVATWGAFVVFAVGARILASDPAVYGRVFDPMWLLAVLVLGPLMSIAAVSVSIMVSSRVSDPRSAEQIAMVVIVPLMGVFFAQITGLVLLNVSFVLLCCAVMLLLDAGLVRLSVELFQRETILTKWK